MYWWIPLKKFLWVLFYCRFSDPVKQNAKFYIRNKLRKSWHSGTAPDCKRNGCGFDFNLSLGDALMSVWWLTLGSLLCAEYNMKHKKQCKEYRIVTESYVKPKILDIVYWIAALNATLFLLQRRNENKK